MRKSRCRFEYLVNKHRENQINLKYQARDASMRFLKSNSIFFIYTNKTLVNKSLRLIKIYILIIFNALLIDNLRLLQISCLYYQFQ